MNTVITLILILSPCILSLPQYSEDAYKREFEEPEAQQYDEDSQYQKRVPVAAEKPARPFARVVHRVAQPTSASLPERYSRPQPQLFTRQEETYNRPSPQLPTLFTQDEKYIKPQIQTVTPPQEEEYNRPLLQIQSIQAASLHEDKYKAVDNKYSTPIPIIKYDKSQSLDGSYKTSYETGNNIVAEESGFIKNIGVKDQEALVQQGSYSYTAPDGTVINTSYTADEGGFRVEGSHIPTPPPIPEEIRKALETIYEGIKQQQEAEAREAKYGKTRPGSAEETNSISDNYPTNYPTFT